ALIHFTASLGRARLARLPEARGFTVGPRSSGRVTQGKGHSPRFRRVAMIEPNPPEPIRAGNGDATVGLGAMPPAGAVPLVVRNFGDYELLEEIASGGMGG